MYRARALTGPGDTVCSQEAHISGRETRKLDALPVRCAVGNGETLKHTEGSNGESFMEHRLRKEMASHSKGRRQVNVHGSEDWDEGTAEQKPKGPKAQGPDPCISFTVACSLQVLSFFSF